MKTFNHHKIATLTIAMMGVAFFALGAHADETSSVTVRYSDLKPNSTADAMVLCQRIHTAAIKVCSDGDGRRLKVAMAIKACEDQAIARSVLAVNNVQLTHVANEHGLVPAISPVRRFFSSS
jgi:UrcA family protein